MIALVIFAAVHAGGGSLDGFKTKTVGNGQHGTARWATKQEIRQTYHHVPFQPEQWRKGENLPKTQGIVLGSSKVKGKLCALVDSDDIHCLMIGASGVGKTAYFLYPNLEYACASGMSWLALDTKGDLARNYGTIAHDFYGYHVAVIDLRNPSRSDGFNFLTLVNHYIHSLASIWGFYHNLSCASADFFARSGGVMWRNVPAASGFSNHGATWSFRSTSGIRW